MKITQEMWTDYYKGEYHSLRPIYAGDSEPTKTSIRKRVLVTITPITKKKGKK